jgi:hypothetical protein
VWRGLKRRLRGVDLDCRRRAGRFATVPGGRSFWRGLGSRLCIIRRCDQREVRVVRKTLRFARRRRASRSHFLNRRSLARFQAGETGRERSDADQHSRRICCMMRRTITASAMRWTARRCPPGRQPQSSPWQPAGMFGRALFGVVGDLRSADGTYSQCSDIALVWGPIGVGFAFAFCGATRPRRPQRAGRWVRLPALFRLRPPAAPAAPGLRPGPAPLGRGWRPRLPWRPCGRLSRGWVVRFLRGQTRRGITCCGTGIFRRPVMLRSTQLRWLPSGFPGSLSSRLAEWKRSRFVFSGIRSSMTGVS